MILHTRIEMHPDFPAFDTREKREDIIAIAEQWATDYVVLGASLLRIVGSSSSFVVEIRAEDHDKHYEVLKQLTSQLRYDGLMSHTSELVRVRE